MIKTVNLQKIFKTEEVQTLALNDVNIEVKDPNPQFLKKLSKLFCF